MAVLIVGGDSLGVIKDGLKDMGFNKIYHITGRKKKKARQLVIPQDINLILVLTDYTNHNLMESVKCKAKDKEVDCIFVCRSWSRIYKKMQLCNYCPGCQDCPKN